MNSFNNFIFLTFISLQLYLDHFKPDLIKIYGANTTAWQTVRVHHFFFPETAVSCDLWPMCMKRLKRNESKPKCHAVLRDQKEINFPKEVQPHLNNTI